MITTTFNNNMSRRSQGTRNKISIQLVWQTDNNNNYKGFSWLKSKNLSESVHQITSKTTYMKIKEVIRSIQSKNIKFMVLYITKKPINRLPLFIWILL